MMPPFDYRVPTTLQDACELLWTFGKGAKVIAGGTDLVIALRNGDHRPRCLIDVTRVGELRGIDGKDETIRIGAAVTHAEIATSPLVRSQGKVLSEACSWVGSPQIRNLGTIGGNIVNASPAADSLPPLIVLDAKARVVSKEGEREIPLAGLFKGPYETSLKPHELLVQVAFPKLPQNARTGYVRLARREAMAVARMSVAVVVQRAGGQGTIEDIRISAGSVTPRPCRLSDAEKVLRGSRADLSSFQAASRKISEEMIRWSGVRASTSYKAPVVEALFVRALRQALEGSL